MSAESLRRQCRRTLEELRKFPEDPKELRQASPELKDLLRTAARLYARLTPSLDVEVWLKELCSEERSESLVEQAVGAFQRGLAERGQSLFARAREADPADPEVDNSEGICWFEAGRLAQARELLSQARELARQRLPQRRKAWSWSELEIRPYLRATYNLGLVRQREGALLEAADLWRECLSLCPEDAVGARFVLPPALQRLGLLEEALRIYREHLGGEAATVPDLYFDMATALVEAGDESGALQRILEGSSLNRAIPPVLLGLPLGAARSRPGDPASAAWAQEYLKGSRDLWSRRALELLGRIWRAPSFQRQLASLEKAEEELRAAGPEQKPLMIHRLFNARKRLTTGRWRQTLQAEVFASSQGGISKAPP